MEKLSSNISNDANMNSLEMSVYYGSQTGTSAGFAKIIVDEAGQFGAKSKLIDLAVFNPDDLKNDKLAVFVVSTYGRGGPSDNAKKFYQWLMAASEITPDFLKNTKFAVFGCGDKGFKFFNKMAKDVTEKLLARGAQKICDSGLGDASEDLESEFGAWKIKFWDAVKSTCAIKQELTPKIADISHKHEPDLEISFEEKDIVNFDFSKVQFDLMTKQYIDSSIFINPI